MKLSQFFLFTLSTFVVFVVTQNSTFPPDFINYSPLGPVPLNVAINPNLTCYMNLAALLPYTYPGNPYNTYVTSMVRGHKLWEYNTNNRRDNPGIIVNNKRCGVNVTIINHRLNNDEIISTAQGVANGTWGNFDAVFPPLNSPWVILTGEILIGMVAISPYTYVREVYECGDQYYLQPPCTVPSSRRYPYLWTVQSPNDLYWDSAFNLLKLKGSKTLSVIVCNEPITYAEISGGVLSATRNNFILLNTLVSNISITPDAEQNPFYVTTNAADSDYEILVRALLTLNADIVLAGVYPTAAGCNSFIKFMRMYNFAPNALLLHSCAAVFSTEDLRYTIDISLWDNRLRGVGFADDIDWKTNDNGISSVYLFDSTYYNYFNVLPDPLVVQPYVAGYAFELALEKSGSPEPAVIAEYFSLISETSIWGEISFDGFGMNSNRQPLYIQQNSTYNSLIVFPLGSSNGEIIYPFVAWNSRIFNPTILGTTEEKVMFALYILEIVYTVICFGVLYKNWDRRSIKASSPIFMTIMLVGSLMIYSTVPSWMIWTDVASCHLRLWFLNLGFTLLFGTLTAKTHRIKTLFLLKKMRPKKFSDRKLLILVGALVTIDIILLILWSAISAPYVYKVVVVSGSGKNDGTLWENLNYLDCYYNTVVMTIFLSIEGVYKVLMVGYGLYLSLLLWKYGSSMWVESKQIIFAMYNLIIFSLIGLALQLSLTSQDESTRKVLFVTRSICVFLSGTITIATILLPRLMDPEGKAHEGQDTTGSKKTVDTAVQLNDLEWKYEVLEKKYKDLKKRHRETNPDDPLSEDM